MKIGKKQHASNLEFLLDNTRDVIWSIDADMRLVCSNRAFNEFIERVVGFKPNVGDKVDFAAFGEETLAYWRSLYLRALSGEQFTIELVDERSENPYNEVTFNPITDSTGQIVGVGCFSRDITAFKLKELELKRAHQEIKDSGDRYKAMIQCSSDIVLLVDENGNRTYVSPSVKTMLGYEPEELLGQPVFDHIHPDELPYITSIFAAATADPSIQVPVQVRFRHKNGTWRYLHIISSNQLANPAVGAMVANIRDVTEQVEAEQKLRESERHYRSLAENFPNGNIGLLDRNLNFKYLAGGDLKLYGIDPQTFLGTHYPSNFEPEHQEFVKDKMIQVLNGKDTTFQVPYGGFTYIVSAVPLFDEKKQINEVLLVAQNISQQKRVEDALRESEEKFRMLSEHSPVGIFEVAPNGYCTWMNERMCEIFGMELSDGLGYGFTRYFHPDDNEHLRNTWLTYANKNEITPVLTFRILTKDRQVRWVYTQAAPMRNTRGEVVAYVGTIEDISELKHYQDELLASRDYQENIMNTMPDGVIFLDDAWRITYVNNKAETILKLSKAEMLGNSMWEQFSGPLGIGFYKNFIQSKADRKPFSLTDYYPAMNIWLEVNGVPNKDGFLVYFRDVSEKMELEYHIDRIYQMSPTMLGIVDAELHFSNFNPALPNLLGFSETELKSKPFYEFMHPEDRKLAIDLAQNILSTGGYARTIENRYLTKSGELKWVSWSAYGQQERKIAYFVANDITRRKELEAERERYQDQLEQTVQKRTAQLLESNHELEAFNYTVSHDLRTPIRAIQMFVTLLERNGLSSVTQNEYLGNIKTCADEMTTLINVLLEFSRLRRHELNRTKVDMERLATETANYLVSMENRTDINLKIGKLAPAHADFTLIKSVWQNLLSNALKYSKHSKPIKISISSKSHQNMVEYCITDNGIGFDMKYAHKLFKPFSRLHSGAEYQGTGAGLAIVERIMTRHGGKVRVEAEPGKGSKFYFSLPLHK